MQNSSMFAIFIMLLALAGMICTLILRFNPTIFNSNFDTLSPKEQETYQSNWRLFPIPFFIFVGSTMYLYTTYRSNGL